MKVNRILLVLCLVLALLLSGCGRSLDPETQAMAEKSDAICVVKVSSVEEGQANWVGTGKGRLLKCMLYADFLGNLTELGISLNVNKSRSIFVLLDGEEDVPGPGSELLLFLNVLPGYTVREPLSGRERLAFVPCGTAGVRREPYSRENQRLLEAVRLYGRAHPRELLENATLQDGKGASQ